MEKSSFLSKPFKVDNYLTWRMEILQECVMTALDKKTVVLVTHQVEFLSEVDRILVS